LRRLRACERRLMWMGWCVVSDVSRYRRAVEMIRRGAEDESVRIATGLSRTVIKTLRQDIEREDRQ
jgi:hypothetical protein